MPEHHTSTTKGFWIGVVGTGRGGTWSPKARDAAERIVSCIVLAVGMLPLSS